MSDIPAGYQLHIHTWENDADSKAVEVLSGLTVSDVKFYIALASMFKSTSSYPECLGNKNADPNSIIQAISTTLNDHPDISANEQEFWSDVVDSNDDYIAYEAVADFILGYPVSEYYCEAEWFCRVYEKCEVYWLEKPSLDVTSQILNDGATCTR